MTEKIVLGDTSILPHPLSLSRREREEKRRRSQASF